MNSFLEIIQTSEKIIKTIESYKPEQEDLLRKSIELWHRKGYFNSLSSKELTDFIFDELISGNSQDNPFLDMIFDLYVRTINLTNNRKIFCPTIDQETQSWITKFGLDPINMDDFKHCIEEIYPNKKMNSIDENTKKIIVYLGFILSSVTVAILAKKAIKDNQKKRTSQENLLSASPKVLVLVVSHQEFENYFYGHGNKLSLLSKDDCKNLYKITKFIWLGSEYEFNSLELYQWFDRNNHHTSQNYSDYDVRLIKISLKEYRGDFKKGSTNRLPEFKGLSENIIEGVISERLPPKAYEYPEFYR